MKTHCVCPGAAGSTDREPHASPQTPFSVKDASTFSIENIEQGLQVPETVEPDSSITLLAGVMDGSIQLSEALLAGTDKVDLAWFSKLKPAMLEVLGAFKRLTNGEVIKDQQIKSMTTNITRVMTRTKTTRGACAQLTDLAAALLDTFDKVKVLRKNAYLKLSSITDLAANVADVAPILLKLKLSIPAALVEKYTMRFVDQCCDQLPVPVEFLAKVCFGSTELYGTCLDASKASRQALRRNLVAHALTRLLKPNVALGDSDYIKFCTEIIEEVPLPGDGEGATTRFKPCYQPFTDKVLDTELMNMIMVTFHDSMSPALLEDSGIANMDLIGTKYPLLGAAWKGGVGKKILYSAGMMIGRHRADELAAPDAQALGDLIKQGKNFEDLPEKRTSLVPHIEGVVDVLSRMGNCLMTVPADPNSRHIAVRKEAVIMFLSIVDQCEECLKKGFTPVVNSLLETLIARAAPADDDVNEEGETKGAENEEGKTEDKEEEKAAIVEIARRKKSIEEWIGLLARLAQKLKSRQCGKVSAYASIQHDLIEYCRCIGGLTLPDEAVTLSDAQMVAYSDLIQQGKRSCFDQRPKGMLQEMGAPAMCGLEVALRQRADVFKSALLLVHIGVATKYRDVDASNSLAELREASTACRLACQKAKMIDSGAAAVATLNAACSRLREHLGDSRQVAEDTLKVAMIAHEELLVPDLQNMSLELLDIKLAGKVPSLMSAFVELNNTIQTESHLAGQATVEVAKRRLDTIKIMLAVCSGLMISDQSAAKNFEKDKLKPRDIKLSDLPVALAEHLQHLAQGAADGEGGAEAADEAA